MADNIELNAGTGGATVAADDVGGVHYQVVKIDVGGDGASAPLSTSNPIPVSDAGGSLSIDDGGNTITVDGTVAVSGTVTVTGSGGTFPVTDSGGSLTVDGTVAATQSGTWTVQPGNTANTTAWLVTGTGGTFPVTDSGGSITVDNGGTFAVQVSSLPASTNTIEIVGDAATDAAVAGNPVYIAGRGNNATPTAMSAANDVTPFWLTLTGAQVVAGDIIDDAAFTPATSRVQAVGYFADETSTDSVDEGDLGAARMTLDRKQVTATYVHAAAGGHTPFKSLDLDESEEEIKGSAGKLFWIHAMNMSASVRYLKFYNATAANVTVGTTTPVLTFPLPTMADTNGAGFAINFGDAGLQFTTAICAAATTGLADNDTGAPGANEVVLNCGYV